MRNLSQSYPLRNPGVAFKRMLEEVVLLNLTTGVYYSSNETGADIWELCDGTVSIEHIISKMVELFDLEHEQAQEHLLEFLGDLEQEGLVKINDANSP